MTATRYGVMLQEERLRQAATWRRTHTVQHDDRWLTAFKVACINPSYITSRLLQRKLSKRSTTPTTAASRSG